MTVSQIYSSNAQSSADSPLEQMSPSPFKPDDLTAFWRSVIDPNGVGPDVAIASELASHTGESVDAVLNKMRTGGDDFNQLWRDAKVNVGDAHSVASFYRDQFTEAYELANWHAGKTFGTFPLNYAKTALNAKRLGLKNALDFGCGIGSGTIALSLAGCDVYAADVANQLMSFAQHRLRSRHIPAQFIDLGAGEQIPKRQFDLICCFDVLEHVPDELAKLRELSTYLRPGGYLFVNFYENPIGEDHAMHVSGAGDWINLVRKTAFIPAWEFYELELQVLRYQPYGRLYNAAAALKERVQSLAGNDAQIRRL